MDLQNIIVFAKNSRHEDYTGHDFLHLQRVCKTASWLYQQENSVDKEMVNLIQATSYLHEALDDKFVTDLAASTAKIELLLRQTGFSDDQQQAIIYTLNHQSFADNLEHEYQLPEFGKYVQDADRIDALGAIGIARAFAFGSTHQQAIYDPAIKVQAIASKRSYRKHSTTTINHFYEKLLKLPQTMNTDAGRKLAQKRANYMEDFLAEFMAECGQ